VLLARKLNHLLKAGVGDAPRNRAAIGPVATVTDTVAVDVPPCPSEIV